MLGPQKATSQDCQIQEGKFWEGDRKTPLLCRTTFCLS